MRDIKIRYAHKKGEKIVLTILTLEQIEENQWNNLDVVCREGYVMIANDLYTGLKDKNGKEIYEGDICQREDSLLQILWQEEKMQFGMKVIKTDYVLTRGLTFPMWQEFTNGFTQLKVIGNIYENPDLLGK